MHASDEREEEKTQEKYTQFIPPYPNKYEPDLELEEFPTFTNIELRNPTKSELSLREEESKRLHIVYDNNNNFPEDKNINEIISNNFKNSNKYNDIYNIDLPECFMRSSMNITKKEKIEEIEEKKEDKIKQSNANDYDIEIDMNFTEKEMEDMKKELNNNYIENEKEDLGEFEKEKENNAQMRYMDSEELNKHYKMFYIDENDFKEEHLDKRKKIFDNHIEENKLKVNNDNFEIEIDNEKKDNPDSNHDNHPREKKKSIKIKMKNNKNSKTKEKENEITHDITTLNINGLNSNEYYLGEIIEKGPNYPSTLGIVKYMNLDLFSENYFGELLQFNEIAMKDDFQKIIRLIPIGNKKYIFSNINSPKSDISKEDNDLIILHGKGGQETFYYIMKLTGQINGSSEYTIYKLKNTDQIIKHFKDSIGLNTDDIQEKFQGKSKIAEGIDYGINDNPNIKYYIMTGKQFLDKYRKLIKKEKEVEDKKNSNENKKNFNLDFEKKYNLLEQEYSRIIDEKILEKENRTKIIQNKKDKLNSILKIEKNNNEELKKMNIENKRLKKEEEELKLEMHRIKKNYNNILSSSRQIENMNNMPGEINGEEFILEKIEELNNSRESLNELKIKLKKLKEKVLCYNCNEKRREVIYRECNHLVLCEDCHRKRLNNMQKKKAECPICNKISKIFFIIQKK